MPLTRTTSVALPASSGIAARVVDAGADLLLVGDGVLQIDDDRVGAEACDLAELARVAPGHEQQRPQQPILPIHSFSLVASARLI